MKEQQGSEKDHGNVDLLSHRLSNVKPGLTLQIKKIGLRIQLMPNNSQKI